MSKSALEDTFAFQLDAAANALFKYIAELEAMVDKLIEAGEVMKQACGDQWGWEDMFDDSDFTDFDDLATGWKERER